MRARVPGLKTEPVHRVVHPAGWRKPAGYANAISARGRWVFLGGQIGWNREQQFESHDLVGQVRQALQNILAILAAADAGPEHLASMTWYFTDLDDYLANLEPIGAVYRELIGRHYPAMAAVEVSAFVEARAKVEIQAIAVVPD